MPSIHECNKSFDARSGIYAVLNFIHANSKKILYGKIINVNNGESVIESPSIELIEKYEIMDNKKNEWPEFYNLYKSEGYKNKLMFSNPFMSTWIQIRPNVVSNLSSALRIGFNLCVLNGTVSWQGMGPICNEMLVTNDDLNVFIESLNNEYVN